MRKYYYKDAAGEQFGPVKLDVLKTKNLKPESPVWYDPLPKWTTAGEIEELKNLILQATVTAKEEIKTPASAEVKPVFDPKRKYYYKDASGQQFGPVKLDVLKTKNLKPESPVWYDPLPKWTTAAELDEIKIFLPRIEPVIAEEIKTVPVIEMKEDPKLTVVETPVVEKVIVETPIVNPAVNENVVTEKPAEIVTEIPVAENKIEATPIVEETVITKAAEVVVPVVEKKIEVAPVVSEPVITKVAEVVVPVVEETPATKLPVAEKATVSISSTASVATAPSISVAPVAKPVQPAKQISKHKSTAWISWVLSILVLGAAGYYVYDNIQKSKEGTTASLNLTGTTVANKDDTTNTTATTDLPATETQAADTTATVQTVTTEPVSTTLTTTTTNAAKTELEKKALLKKKADEEKKKQLAAQAEQAKQQADDQRKKEIAAQVALAKELQFRNGWSKYITVGALNYAPKGGDDGVNSFDIPVYNGTDAMIDRVVVKIDYYKKESKEKALHTETVIITNIPPKSAKNGVAPENKRARVARAAITGVNSKKLHLCYPSSNGNSADPYYCN